MSRRRKAKSKAKDYVVPLAEWKSFERFKDRLSHIEDAITDLQENWSFHVSNLQSAFDLSDSDFEIVNDNVARLSDLIGGIQFHEKSKSKRKRKTYFVKSPASNYQQLENRVAVIIIEDITDQEPL